MPGTPKRTAALEAMKAAFELITKPTFNFDLDPTSVTIGGQSHESGPRITIELFADIALYEPEAADGTETLFTVDVFGRLRPVSTEDGDTAIEKLVQDIINAIHTDIRLGGAVTRVWAIESEIDDGLEDLDDMGRWCRVGFQVQQFHGLQEH